MRKLGVIGGLGPMATAYYLQLVIQMTDARCDQEHIDMIIYNRPGIPDRTKYILGLSDMNPTIPIIETGKVLVEQGVECIAIPCITAHYFHNQLEAAIGRPIIHLIKETVSHLRIYGVETVGIMATDGTIASCLFQRELELQGLKTVVPTAVNQKRVMHLIYENVKAGHPIEMRLFFEVVGQLRNSGAQVIVLGCTELSLIKQTYDMGPGFLDAMEVLAMQSIRCCEAPLKQEYHCLITR